MTDINIPPRAFKVGDDVVCLNFGTGKVTSNTGLYGFPIQVKFNNMVQGYTNNGQRLATSKRCLFHADENVKVTVTAPVYEYQVIFKRKEFEKWDISNAHYKTAGEFKDNLNQYEYIELFLPSKRRV